MAKKQKTLKDIAQTAYNKTAKKAVKEERDRRLDEERQASNERNRQIIKTGKAPEEKPSSGWASQAHQLHEQVWSNRQKELKAERENRAKALSEIRDASHQYARETGQLTGWRNRNMDSQIARDVNRNKPVVTGENAYTQFADRRDAYNNRINELNKQIAEARTMIGAGPEAVMDWRKLQIERDELKSERDQFIAANRSNTTRQQAIERMTPEEMQRQYEVNKAMYERPLKTIRDFENAPNYTIHSEDEVLAYGQAQDETKRIRQEQNYLENRLAYYNMAPEQQENMLKYAREAAANADSLETGTFAKQTASKAVETDKLKKQIMADTGMDEETFQHAYDTASRLVNQERAENLKQQVKQMTAPELAVQNVLTVANNFLKPGDLPEIVNAAVNEIPVDVNALKATGLNDIVRGETSERIQQSKFAPGLLNFLYQTGMSMADFAAMIPLDSLSGTSALSLAFMGTGAGIESVKEATERGLTARDAFETGLMAGIFEAMFEKISIEALLNPTVGEQTARYILKNMLAEGSEEICTSIANNIADRLHNGELSEYNQSVLTYISQGYGRAEAEKLAKRDFAVQLSQDFLGGAVSGGVMASVTSQTTYYRAATLQNRLNDLQSQNAQMIEDMVSGREEFDLNRLSQNWAEQEQVVNQINELMGESSLEAGEEAEAEAETSEPAAEFDTIEELDAEIEYVGEQLFEVDPESEEAQGLQARYDELQEMRDNWKENNELPVRNSSERNDSQNPGGSVSSVESQTGRDAEIRRFISKAADKSLSGVEFAEAPETAVDLGIPDGDTRSKVYRVTGNLSQPLQDTVKAFTDRGFKAENVILFAGGELTRTITSGGIQVEDSIRGAVMPSEQKVFLRVDDPSDTAMQIGVHEITHDRIAAGEINVVDEISKIVNRIGAEKTRELIDKYASAFDGLDLGDIDVAEEIVCDAHAKINIFKNMGGEASENMQQASEAVRETANETQTRGPPETKASRKADQKALEKLLASKGVEIIDGSAIKASRASWDRADKTKIIDGLVKAGFTKADAQAWVNDVNSIAAIIASDIDRLDYESADNHSMLKPNAEYVTTLDASTLCAKRLLYQGTYNAIAHELQNRPLMAEDVIKLRNMMDKAGLEVPCGICYVESRRKALGKFASEWLETYKGSYIPSLDEVVSSDGLEKLRKAHPDTYNDFIKAMNKKGTVNPKVVELRAEYDGEILKLTKGQIAKEIRIGGQRVQSFSDFETPHLIDMMQAVIDMAQVKLTSQAYTKVPNFAWVFGNTGIKINLSLIGDVDANGKLTFDNKEGMPFEEAMKLRDAYSENVGTILVGKNDKHILAAMADDRIDFIIPFHRSGWGKADYEALGLSGYEDYTNYQNEKMIDGSKFPGNLYPIDYWDYSKSGKENAEIYLKLCKEQGRIPKFSNFLVDNGDGSWSLQPDGSTDGYWKTLIDFKMYNNDGVGAPQRAVTPDFNMEQANRVLGEYKGGANSLPVADDIVKKFVEEYNKEHDFKASRSVDSEGTNLSQEQEEYFKDSKIRDEDGNLQVVYHGTAAEFTVFDRTKGRSTMDIQGSFFSPWDIDAAGYGPLINAYYLNITNPAPEGVAYKALNRFKGQNDAGVKAREYLESLGYDGVNNGNEEYIAFNPEQIKLASNPTPTSDPDIRFSRAAEVEEKIKEISAKKRKSQADRIFLRDAGEKLSEKDFYALYNAHKIDLRRNGNVDEQVESIKRDGFKGDGGFGYNIMPATINNVSRYTEDERRAYLSPYMSEEEVEASIKDLRENPGRGEWYDDVYFPEINVMEGKYGGRAGDTVLLVPEHETVNGERVKNGFKPFDYEVVKVERAFQPYYELYSKAYDAAHAQGPGVRASRTVNENDDADEVSLLKQANKELLRQITELKKERAAMEMQARGAQRTITQQSANLMAKDWKDKLSSTMKQSEIAAKFKELGDWLKSGSKDISILEARKRSRAIAKELVDTAKVLRDDFDSQAYETIKGELKRPMTISAKDASSIADFNEWRKHHFGKINIRLGTEGYMVDQAYMQLNEMYPDYFPDDIANPADQLLRMADVYDSIQPVYDNPFDRNYDEALNYAETAILEDAIGLETYADKKDAEMDALKKKCAEQIQKVKEDRDKQIQAIKDAYKERRAKQQESNERTRLLKIAKRLRNRKMPAVTRAKLDEYIGDLDLVAKSMTGITEAKLEELQDWYKKQQEDPDFIPNPTIEAKLERLHKRQINDLTALEVADLVDILLNIENELRTKDKFIKSEIAANTHAAGQQVIADIENTKGPGKGDKVTTGMLTPEREARRVTGYRPNDPLYLAVRELSRGANRQVAYQNEAERQFTKWTHDKKFVKDFAGPKAKEISLEMIGMPNVKITPAMRASLWLHSLNPDNMRHIANGGVTIPDMKLYRQGKIQEAYDKGTTIKLKPSQVRAIASQMTGTEKAYASAASKYFNETSHNAINEVSEAKDGFSIANVDNYFPIDTNKAFLKSDFETLKKDGTIEGMGFTKQRVNASNPIMLYDMDTVLNKSISQHAKYVGLAIPVRNFNKLWNVGTWFDGTEPSGVQNSLIKVWGRNAYEYFQKMMTDLQNPSSQSDDIGKMLGKIRSRYAAAVLELNLSVAIKQAASYPTAAAVLGWGPLIKAMGNVGKVNLDTVYKYSPMQAYREKGFASQELGEITSRKGKTPTLLNWIQGMDAETTRKLWKASEYYVREHFPNIKRGTDEYFRKVGEIHTQVLEETQPNYTVMQRPQFLRSDSDLTKTLMMFKTQPFQNFNILYDALQNYRAAHRAAKNGATDVNVKGARRALARAISSQAAASFVFALMQYAWDAFRKKDDKYKEDGETTFKSWLKGMNINMLNNGFGMLPFGSEIFEQIEVGIDKLLQRFGADAYFDAKAYGLSDSIVEQINNTVNAVTRMSDALMTIGTEDWDAKAALDTARDSALTIAQYAGIPAKNVKNLYQAAKDQIDAVAQGQDPNSFQSKQTTATRYIHKLPEWKELDEKQQTKLDREITKWAQDTGSNEAAKYVVKNKPVPEGLRDTAAGKIIDGKDNPGVSPEEFFSFRVALFLADRPTKSGETGTFDQAETMYALQKAKLTDRERRYIWSYYYKSDYSEYLKSDKYKEWLKKSH